MLYEKLRGSREIRLLEFLNDDEPSCRLVHAELDKTPYAALSYTWGANIFNHVLKIHGSSFAITENLHDALKALNRHVRNSGLMLWVDAVCINQQDIQERNHQVRLMSAVYGSAKTVLVWLGNPYADSNLAMDKMKEWDAEVERLCDGDFAAKYNNFHFTQSSSIYYGPVGSEPHRAWLAILALWERPWWRRAWIVQEATALSIYDTQLVCGDRMVNMRCLRTILDMRYALAQFPDHYMTATYEQGFGELIDNFKSWREEDPDLPLLNVLRQIRSYECKDPRDKVFAALGMATDVSESELVPDYTKSVEAVYTDVADYIIRTTKETPLDFLGYVMSPTKGSTIVRGEGSKMPSWLPDWMSSSDIIPIRKSLAGNNGIGTRAYNASGSLLPHIEIDIHILSVRGILLDTVVNMTTSCDNRGKQATTTERTWTPANPNDAYPLGGTVGEAFNHVLVADIGRPEPRSKEYRRGVAMDWPLADTDVATLDGTESVRRMWKLNDLDAVTFGRRVLYTERGYMGIGPAASELGDTVCVLFGGQVLYVLRSKNNGQYEFVGECYIHRLMDGQAVESVDEDLGPKSRIISMV